MRSSGPGVCVCVKVGGPFTPVPKGCRAEETQLEVRSLVSGCPWHSAPVREVFITHNTSFTGRDLQVG